MSSGNNKSVRVSVGQLVAFVARSGDLGGSGTAGPTAQQGVAGHTWLAKQKPKCWQAEVSLKRSFSINEIDLQLAGRVDFVRVEPGKPLLVEEVKTCLGDPRRDFGASDHWAQAKMYGFLLAQYSDFLTQHRPYAQLTASNTLSDESAIDIRLTRLDLLSRKSHSETQTLTVAQLVECGYRWLDEYCAWLAAVGQHKTKMIASAQQLKFPYPQYRPQQQAVARQVFRCIRDQSDLLLQAPTGSGKTVSVCFPAAKALGETVASRVVYLTTKSSSQAVVLEGLAQLRRAGLHIALLQLTAKAKACPCQVENSHNALDQPMCQRRLGYYDRLPAARAEAMALAWLDNNAVQAIADQHNICPFEFSLEMAGWVDWLVCDVNYWYDPVIRMANLERGDKPLLLVDEIHNLPDRVRAMFSAALTPNDFTVVKNQVLPSIASKLASRAVDKCQRLLRQLLRGCNAEEQIIEAEDLYPLIEQIEKLLATIDEARAVPEVGTISSLFVADAGLLLQPLRRFIALKPWLGDQHIVVLYPAKKNNGQCQIACLNAGPLIAARRHSVQNTVGFSATLSPADYYRDNLGWSEADEDQLQWLQLPSYFPVQNRSVSLVNFVNTRWQSRAHSLPHLIAAINAVTQSQEGNYLLFLPSYDYIEQLLAASPQDQSQHWLVQSPTGDEQSRRDFLNALIHAQKPTLALAVLGGVFAEALDIPNSALQGVIVVGTGMGQPNAQNKALQQYWHEQGRDGFDYSFRVPGFAKVVQAAGRVVRSEHDQGVVVLIDDRFAQTVYQRWFPPHWQPQLVNNAESLRSHLQAFWRSS